METNVFLLAKYPFLNRAKAFLETQGILSLEEISRESEYEPVIRRSFERIRDAIIYKKIFLKNENLIDFKTEILSFPVSVAIVSAINDNMLRNIYATAEAKRVYEQLKSDSFLDLEVILEDQKIEFYRCEELKDSYKLPLHEYLRVSPQRWGKTWKLVNREIKGGFIYVSRDELSRITSEIVKEEILEKSKTYVNEESMSGKLKETYLQLKRIWEDYKAKFVKVDEQKVDQLPPCMNKLLLRQKSGENLSHVERRSLVTYLIAIGYTIEEIMSIMRSSPDFNEKIARYQVEHLAGLRGSRKKYAPPKCETMRAYGLCFPDKWCNGIRHPLQYKRRQEGNKS